MLSFQIKDAIERIFKSFDEAKYFFDCLESINSSFLTLEECIYDIATGNKINEATNKLRNHLSQTRTRITDVKPMKFFSTTAKLQAELKKVMKFGYNNSDHIDEIEKKLNEFSQTYETYIENYTPQSASKMVFDAHSLLSMLDSFRKGLGFYLANIEGDSSEFENGRELSIVLQSTMTLSEFIEKLSSIEFIYNELCTLFNISGNEFPLQIIKIESGSLWAKIFGNSKVIALLTNLIESGVGYVYRNYTTEGHIVSIPKKVEVIESVLMLSTRLKEHGINVEELNDNINKSSVLLAKELNKLISGQPEIIINNNKMSIGDELQKKLIETKAPLKLEFNNE